MIGFPALIYARVVFSQKVLSCAHQIQDFFYILTMHTNMVIKSLWCLSYSRHLQYFLNLNLMEIVILKN